MKNILQKMFVRFGGLIFIIVLLSACVTNGYHGGW